ncbi:unnamed protein product, partial [Meganyctiphanes norvegica]
MSSPGVRGFIRPHLFETDACKVESPVKRNNTHTIFTKMSHNSYIASLVRSTPMNRSHQTSQLMEGSGQYTLESYGSSLPALIMEALTFADRNIEMSAVLSPSGWAWLVCGRRLLVWRYRQQADNQRMVNHQFRELTLPPSDLAHRAQLVVVYAPTDGQVPACIAVSPEGFVRYWPSIAHEGSYHEISTELQGQECESLIFLGASLGCLLATTTSTTLLIQPAPHQHHKSHEHTLSFKML